MCSVLSVNARLNTKIQDKIYDDLATLHLISPSIRVLGDYPNSLTTCVMRRISDPENQHEVQGKASSLVASTLSPTLRLKKPTITRLNNARAIHTRLLHFPRRRSRGTRRCIYVIKSAALRRAYIGWSLEGFALTAHTSAVRFRHAKVLPLSGVGTSELCCLRVELRGSRGYINADP